MAGSGSGTTTSERGEPRAEESAARPPRPGLRPSEAVSFRILFVDDSPSVRDSYRKLLERHDYSVTTAADADAGFDLARDGGFDLAVIDYLMPGCTGDELCRRLAGDPRTAPLDCLVITSANRPEVIRDCLAAGAVDCVFKHEPEDLFLARIASVARGIEARRAEESRSRHLESILACVGNGVFGVDRAGRITFVNSLALRILGWDREDGSPIGIEARSLFHHAGEDGREVPVEDCPLTAAYRSGGELRAWETVFVHRSGRPVPVECSVYPFTIAGRNHGSIVAFLDVSERRHLYERMWWMATHDLLTSLQNRRFFEDQLSHELERLRQEGGRSALLLYDIDHFRMINEMAGPETGDRILTAVARELERRVGDHDALARLGDDSFAVVVRGVDETSACQAGESIRQALLDCSFDHEGQNHRVRASLGIVLMDRYSPAPGEVVANAELACHLAKRGGRGKLCVHREQTGAQQVVRSQFGWSSRLRSSLQRGDFVLHYQPILRMPDIPMDHLPREAGSIWRTLRPSAAEDECYEVLIRLKDGKGGVIGPVDFLPTAERFNLMTEIDLWVIHEALEALADLHGGERRATLFINLSGQTLGAESLQPFIKAKVRELALDPACLVFEITESDAIQNLEIARSVMEDLQGLGCRFALDDFGSGYSSFRHLKHLPVDILKIDGMFVRGMVNEGPDLAMVASMDEIAHSLGRQTVAESVENAATLRLLKQCGVDFVQGHYICSPLPSLGAS